MKSIQKFALLPNTLSCTCWNFQHYFRNIDNRLIRARDYHTHVSQDLLCHCIPSKSSRPTHLMSSYSRLNCLSTSDSLPSFHKIHAIFHTKFQYRMYNKNNTYAKSYISSKDVIDNQFHPTSNNNLFLLLQVVTIACSIAYLKRKLDEIIECEFVEAYSLEQRYAQSHIGPDTSILVPHVQTQEEATLHARTKLRIQDTSDIVRLNIETSLADTCLLECEPLQKTMYLQKGETSMAFIRVYNPTNYAVRIISVAIVSPVQAVAHVVKQQCFCFEEFTIGGNESLDLPIVFYIDANCPPVETITVDYLFMLQR